MVDRPVAVVLALGFVLRAGLVVFSEVWDEASEREARNGDTEANATRARSTHCYRRAPSMVPMRGARSCSLCPQTLPASTPT